MVVRFLRNIIILFYNPLTLPMISVKEFSKIKVGQNPNNTYTSTAPSHIFHAYFLNNFMSILTNLLVIFGRVHPLLTKVPIHWLHTN